MIETIMTAVGNAGGVWLVSGAIVLAGLFIGVGLARRAPELDDQDDDIAEDMAEMLREQMAGLTQRMQIMAETQMHAQTALQQTFEERLDAVSQRMGQGLTDSATKTAETLGKLTTRLNVIDEAQKHLTDLSGQVVSLQDILSNKQARGAFGEMQMADIVSNALPPSAYTFQATLSNGKRPDCLLELPNPPGAIAVDAKFPLESYHMLVEAEDDAQKKLAMRAFRDAMIKHVKDISEKYILPGETAESALMFLPSEAIYAELHTHFPETVKKSYEARVWIVSPTTFMATLNTVRAVLKDVHIREQAHIIQREVGMLAADVGRLDTRVGKLQTHFAQVTKDISDITTSTEKIVRRAGKIEDLQMGSDVEATPLDNVQDLTSLKRIS